MRLSCLRAHDSGSDVPSVGKLNASFFSEFLSSVIKHTQKLLMCRIQPIFVFIITCLLADLSNK